MLCLLCYSGNFASRKLLVYRGYPRAFSPSAMKIYIPKRKNDQHRDGHYVHISQTTGSVCLVAAVKRFLHDTNLSPSFLLISRLVSTKNGHIAKPAPISYSRARDILRAGLSKYLPNGFNFGTHSLRAGAVSYPPILLQFLLHLWTTMSAGNPRNPGFATYRTTSTHQL